MTQPSIEGTGHGIPRMLYGNDGTNWIAVLVDALGHIQADILSSALPTDAATQTTLAALLTELQAKLETGDLSLEAVTKYLNVVVKTCALPADAATQTTLASCLTALQKIDDLQNTLGSVATDLLRVSSKSGDKIFGFESIVEETLSNNNLSAGTNALNGTAVPAGKVWKITLASANYVGTVTATYFYIEITGLAGDIVIKEERSITSGRWYPWSGEVYLQAGDYMRLVIYNATAGDDANLRYSGVQMNAP